MMTRSWYAAALGAIGLLLSADVATAQLDVRLPVSPGYRGRDACPSRCSIAGPNSANWSAYHNFGQFQSCQHTMFYTFSLYDQVDDPDALHRIYACTSYGTDWVNLPPSPAEASVFEAVNTTYEIGRWSDGSLATPGVYTLSEQMRHYLANGYGPTDGPVILFGQSGEAAVGLYVGEGLQSQGTSPILKAFEYDVLTMGAHTEALAMQHCEPGYNGDHVFGVMATSNGSFSAIQDALRSWDHGECLSFAASKNVTGPALFTTPKSSPSPEISANTTALAVNGTSKQSESKRIFARGECKTIQVRHNDLCGDLAKRCGVSLSDFEKFNSAGPDFCNTLMPKQHVCCTAGKLPDFSPEPNPDGSCATYTVQDNDNCKSLAVAHGLTVEQLEEFNSNTWGWNGCSNLWAKSVICLSSGSPPMPAPLPNAVCGPQVPGTERPTDGTDLTDLNPCPLNACCDVFGQCGTTAEFCTNTSTGAPGSAKEGTNGCISNCGTNIVIGDAPAQYRKIAYFEGYGFKRPCLYQDALQVDTSQYTHLQFGFGEITQDYQIHIGNALKKYEFEKFKHISGALRILSFGGWDFSTNPKTYMIFREGVKPENRLKFATNIANFIKANNLDGVDIDWEYPGAQDIPNVPPADEEDGERYLAFLVVLKNLLGDKSVSIAAPASYWYLKGFPIAHISKVVDYIVYMTYDLHGQWDAENQYAMDGCPSGMCLRSHVNLTETINAFVMITKAGVNSGKVVAGVTSYGRSFEMAEPGCYGVNCQFTGAPSHSNAEKGPCTGTAGYLANAEIKRILDDPSRVNQHYLDQASNSNILVYDDTQWVGYMSSKIRSFRSALYKNFNMGGTTNWATDLESFIDPPSYTDSWGSLKKAVMNGEDPGVINQRTGNWTELTCDSPVMTDRRFYTASQRWGRADCKNALQDAINVWKKHDRDDSNYGFSESVSLTLNGLPNQNCSSLSDTGHCDEIKACSAFKGDHGGGPAATLIWNSFVEVHSMYSAYYNSLVDAAALKINNQLADFENKFAPVPKDDNDGQWISLLMDVVSVGFSIPASRFFNSVLESMSYFQSNSDKQEKVQEISMTLVEAGTSIAKSLMSPNDPSDWSPQDQDEFSHYLGQAIYAWSKVTEVSLASLFDGKDKSIDMLTELISDGKFVAGKQDMPTTINSTYSQSELVANAAEAVFGFAIPALWKASGRHPFIIDSGYDCGVVDPLDEHLSPKTMQKTAGCYGGKLYYLAMPEDDKAALCSIADCFKNKFVPPNGIESLNGTSFGGITVSELITGSVRTYINNGKENGAPVADPSDKKTMEDLFDGDITTPGYIGLPVCSADMAWKAWLHGIPKNNGEAYQNYPCIIPPGASRCGASTFVDQTTEASPSVEDCIKLMKEHRGGTPSWEIENVVGEQHQLIQNGTCKFGVESLDAGNGNGGFYVGNQDIIDIINDSIAKFGDSGKVGAKGKMTCDGFVKGQSVEWGLY